MLTVCAGLFLFLTKLSSDDLPIGALVAIIILCDFILFLSTIGMLFDTGILERLIVVLGSCR